MNAKQKPVSAALSYVRFNNAKTMDAVEATPAQINAYEMGRALGAEYAESKIAWTDALKACKAPDMRKMLRAGFVSVVMPLLSLTKVQADSKFDYLARQYAPAASSRKAKSNAKKRGRKEKATAMVEKLSEKDVASRLVRILAYVARAQSDNKGDDDILAILGTIAKLANGGK